MPDGRRIRITLAKAWRDGARIGIDAPRDIKVLRTELLDNDAVPRALEVPRPAPGPVTAEAA